MCHCTPESSHFYTNMRDKISSCFAADVLGRVQDKLRLSNLTLFLYIDQSPFQHHRGLDWHISNRSCNLACLDWITKRVPEEWNVLHCGQHSTTNDKILQHQTSLDQTTVPLQRQNSKSSPVQWKSNTSDQVTSKNLNAFTASLVMNGSCLSSTRSSAVRPWMSLISLSAPWFKSQITAYQLQVSRLVGENGYRMFPNTFFSRWLYNVIWCPNNGVGISWYHRNVVHFLMIPLLAMALHLHSLEQQNIVLPMGGLDSGYSQKAYRSRHIAFK